MLKPFLLFSAAVLFAIAPMPAPTVASGGTAQEATPPSTNPVKPTGASQEKAKKLYAMDCAICHGDNGNGKTDLATSMNVTLADWTDPKALASISDQQLFDIIRKGKGDKMPPEDASRAKNDEVWGLITHIRGFSKGQPAASAACGAGRCDQAAKLLTRPIICVEVSHPCARKKAQGWGTVLQYLRAGSIGARDKTGDAAHSPLAAGARLPGFAVS